ncbi:MAG: hypothetical protein ACXVA9_06040 [Bdellovibrionales bacterium]
MKSRLALILFLCSSCVAQGQVKAQAKPEKTSENEILDFKDQVIEGSVIDAKSEASGARKASPLFTELGKGDTSMDSIVFKRSDFNDFHDSQIKQRVYVPPADNK